MIPAIRWTVIVAAFMLTGCSTMDKARKADVLELQVAGLTRDIKDLKAKHAREMEELRAAKNKEIEELTAAKKIEIVKVAEKKEAKISELEQAYNDLSRKLERELGDYKTKLEMTERGLVITFLAEIFFDSGKNIIREEAKPTLHRVAEVLNDKIADSYVAVEGYTDNVPIKYSAWKSNWELSSGRALSVVHYFIDEAQVNPLRLSAIGYGEFRPVADNATEEGRQQNRRVEVVILPTKLKKVSNAIAKSELAK